MNALHTQYDAHEMPAPSVSMARAAEMLNVSRRTLYYWIRKGRLQTKRTPLGSQRVLMGSLGPRPVIRSFEAAGETFLLK